MEGLGIIPEQPCLGRIHRGIVDSLCEGILEFSVEKNIS